MEGWMPAKPVVRLKAVLLLWFSVLLVIDVSNHANMSV